MVFFSLFVSNCPTCLVVRTLGICVYDEEYSFMNFHDRFNFSELTGCDSMAEIIVNTFCTLSAHLKTIVNLSFARTFVPLLGKLDKFILFRYRLISFSLTFDTVEFCARVTGLPEKLSDQKFAMTNFFRFVLK